MKWIGIRRTKREHTYFHTFGLYFLLFPFLLYRWQQPIVLRNTPLFGYGINVEIQSNFLFIHSLCCCCVGPVTAVEGVVPSSRALGPRVPWPRLASDRPLLPPAYGQASVLSSGKWDSSCTCGVLTVQCSDSLRSCYLRWGETVTWWTRKAVLLFISWHFHAKPKIASLTVSVCIAYLPVTARSHTWKRQRFLIKYKSVKWICQSYWKFVRHLKLNSCFLELREERTGSR